MQTSYMAPPSLGSTAIAHDYTNKSFTAFATRRSAEGNLNPNLDPTEEEGDDAFARAQEKEGRRRSTIRVPLVLFRAN